MGTEIIIVVRGTERIVPLQRNGYCATGLNRNVQGFPAIIDWGLSQADAEIVQIIPIRVREQTLIMIQSAITHRGNHHHPAITGSGQRLRNRAGTIIRSRH